MSIIRLSDTRFRLQIRRKGFPKVDKVFASREEAEMAEQAALAERREPLASGEEMTLSEAWEGYIGSAEFADKSVLTQKTESGRIRPALATLGAYTLAHLAAKPRLIWNYIDSRGKAISEKTKKKLSSTSIRLELASLSAVAAWAVRRQLILKNFTHDVARPVQGKRKRRVPPLEQGKLELAQSQTEFPAIAQAARFLLLLRFLGCRPGELARLHRCDIHFTLRDVTFWATKFKKEDRLVHMTEQAARFLNNQFAYAKTTAPDSPYLFSTETKRNPDGTPSWNPFNYAWGVKLLREEDLIGKDFHAHAMRREYISRAIESGLPYSTICKQTGHHSTQAIEIYDEGLSTAPEIRQALDDHEKKLDHDFLAGMMQARGFCEEDIRMAIAALKGRDTKNPIVVHYANGEVVDIDHFNPPNPREAYQS